VETLVDTLLETKKKNWQQLRRSNSNPSQLLANLKFTKFAGTRTRSELKANATHDSLYLNLLR
jgi:hypothetical protein